MTVWTKESIQALLDESDNAVARALVLLNERQTSDERRVNYVKIDGGYLALKELESVWEYLTRKAMIWEAGIGVPSSAEKFAYEVLKRTQLERSIDLGRK